MERKIALLPGEVLQGSNMKMETPIHKENPCSDVRLNCKKSAEVIVPEKKKKKIFFLERTEQWKFLNERR